MNKEGDSKRHKTSLGSTGTRSAKASMGRPNRGYNLVKEGKKKRKKEKKKKKKKRRRKRKKPPARSHPLPRG